MFLCFIALSSIHQLKAAAGQIRSDSLVSDDILDRFLELGKWNTEAEDTIYGEELDSDFVQSLVLNYQKDISDGKNANSLGLLVLAEAIGGWGMKLEADFPPDPNYKSWKGTDRIGAGKHLMSYAKGGIGLPHADSGFLKKLFGYLKNNHPELADKEERFFQLEGINYDVLYANGGHCRTPLTVIRYDLNGKNFGHKTFGYAGDSYCEKYQPKADTNEEDWQIFRHWMREALRKRDVQKWIIEYWITKYWIPSYEKIVIKGVGSVEEAFINARIRNSSSVTANCAIEHAEESANRIESQLEAYTLKKCKGKERHKRRFGVMKRPIVLYQHFSK